MYLLVANLALVWFLFVSGQMYQSLILSLALDHILLTKLSSVTNLVLDFSLKLLY